jgi:hypothetical protein
MSTTDAQKNQGPRAPGQSRTAHTRSSPKPDRCNPAGNRKEDEATETTGGGEKLLTENSCPAGNEELQIWAREKIPSGGKSKSRGYKSSKGKGKLHTHEDEKESNKILTTTEVTALSPSFYWN